MKIVTAFLLSVCYFAVSNAAGWRWRCTGVPRLYQAVQVDAGLGKVVAITRNRYVYFLMGNTWLRMSPIRMEHATVGLAGMWASGTNNRVYKLVCGTFKPAGGLSMKQVDAGGDDHVVGVTTNHRAYCLRRSRALAFNGAGSLTWDYLSRILKYYSCGPNMGCWGVDGNGYVYVAKSVNSGNCGHSQWTRVDGRLRMVEVGTDGNVFGVNSSGQVYRRIGITRRRREGTRWVRVPIRMGVHHVSWDLGYLWVVTSSGLIMKCSP